MENTKRKPRVDKLPNPVLSEKDVQQWWRRTIAQANSQPKKKTEKGN